MKTKMIQFSLMAAAALVAVPAAQAQGGSRGGGCCVYVPNGVPVPSPGFRESSPAPSASAPSNTPVAKPVKSVFDNYLRIHAALAADSLEGVAQSASAVAQSVRNDAAKSLPANVTRQADTLAKASDLKSARKAFKPLSDSLIKYVKANNIAGLHEAYCPMAKASWLQADQRLNNPYMGRSMPSCGQFKS